jgi:hypothetical protein
MPAPVILATAYLVINLAIEVWLARAQARERVLPAWVIGVARTLRYGPPLAGLLYLVTIAGDWPFVVFVAAFFAGGFWMLDGLLNYPNRPPKR